MFDIFFTLGINALVEFARNKVKDPQKRKAALKVFRELARAFKDDKEFLTTAKQEFK